MPADTFACIAKALQQTMAERGLADAAYDEAVWDAPARNTLLDACGSDHRPLVDLVLSVGIIVRPRLRALARDVASGTASWERDRAPLVHTIVSTRFLQPDVARWAVDAWAVALGIASRSVLHAPTVASASASVAMPSPTNANAAHAPGVQSPQRPMASGTVRGTTARLGAAPSRVVMQPAAVHTRQRIGSKWPTGPRVTLPPDPRLALRVRRIEKMAVIVVALLVAGVMALLTKALSEPREVTSTPLQVTPEPSAAVRIASTAERIDSAPVTGATSVVPGVADGRDAVARGVGGAYRVVQQVRSVDGSPSCTQVAEALARPLSSIERIDHVPGESRLALSSRLANGAVDPNGFFTFGPREGTTNGVRWRFMMQGRFAAHGFTGESRTETFAVIRWGRTQSCIAVADLVGQRVD